MNQKRVLIISQVIPQWYVDLLSKALGDCVEIDIITGSNVIGKVIRSPEHNPQSFRSRLLSWYKHFRFMKRWVKENKHKSYNLIFAVSNPPINSIIGLKLKRFFNAPFVYMNWDLYPQVIRAAIHNPIAQIVCKIWSHWNSRHYRQIDQIITIGDVMADSINAGIKSKVPVRVIPVGVDTNRLRPINKKDNPFCIENGLVNKFVVLYSGKMGLGHNIEMILEAADNLRENKDIVFVFIGFGPKYDTVKNYIEKNRPENILLFPLQNEEMFPFSMASGDIGIVTQEASMAHLFMPSKVYSMMACGEAIVGIETDHDDLFKLIKDKEIGISIVDGSADSLARSILDLYYNSELLIRFKSASRMVAKREYDISIVTNAYSELFKYFI